VTPEDFIECVVQSMQDLTALYAQGHDGGTYLGANLDSIGLNALQRQYVLALIRLSVGEATHCLLSGIEGQVRMGTRQQVYKLLDENGLELTGGLSDLLYIKLEEEGVLETSLLSRQYRSDELPHED